MVKLLFGLLALALVAYIAWNRYSAEPLDSRATIEAGLEQVKSSTALDPAQEQLLRVQLAISDYMASHAGRVPDSLADLVPKYFDAVPVDPDTGEDYEYVKVDGAYRLGAQIAAAELASSSKVKGGKEKTKDESTSGAEEEFVNPNTMSIEDFVYDPSGKRNPFEPFDFSGDQEHDENVPPLERFAVGQLKVTAILRTANSWNAIVEDQTGRGYPIRQGTRIGNNNGVVASIEKDRVNVVETNVDFTGKENKRVIQMKIQPTVKSPGKSPKRGRARVFN